MRGTRPDWARHSFLHFGSRAPSVAPRLHHRADSTLDQARLPAFDLGREPIAVIVPSCAAATFQRLTEWV